MNEIIFLVEIAPEGGYTARALGESIFTEADDLDELRKSARSRRLSFWTGRKTENDTTAFRQRRDYRGVRLPRDVSGTDLVKALRVLDYEITEQTGSHIRLTTSKNGIHHVTIPNHNSLRVGTFAAILDDIASHFQMTRQKLLSKIHL